MRLFLAFVLTGLALKLLVGFGLALSWLLDVGPQRPSEVYVLAALLTVAVGALARVGGVRSVPNLVIPFAFAVQLSLLCGLTALWLVAPSDRSELAWSFVVAAPSAALLTTIAAVCLWGGALFAEHDSHDR